MTCVCTVGPDGRSLMAVCELHETWARAREERRDHYAAPVPPAQPLDAYGPTLSAGQGKSTTR